MQTAHAAQLALISKDRKGSLNNPQSEYGSAFGPPNTGAQGEQNVDEFELLKEEKEEMGTLWDNFNAQAFQEYERAVNELERKLNPRQIDRRYYKVSLRREDLDKFKPKDEKETNVSLVLFEEIN